MERPKSPQKSNSLESGCNRFKVFIPYVLAIAIGTVVNPAHADDKYRLQQNYKGLQEKLRKTPFSSPIHFRSQRRKNFLSAEVFGLIKHPYSAVVNAIWNYKKWCDFIPLHQNVKSCIYRKQNNHIILVLYMGRKHIIKINNRYVIRYKFNRIADNNYIRISLSADEGPTNTTDYNFFIEAIPAGKDTFLHMRISLTPSLLSKLATNIYLKTLGRKKIGFSIIGRDKQGHPVYIKGIKGALERNVMRYYLALGAYLQTRDFPKHQRFIASIKKWYGMTEKYHKQLYEMPRKQYISIKMKQRKNQKILQKSLINSR